MEFCEGASKQTKILTGSDPVYCCNISFQYSITFYSFYSIDIHVQIEKLIKSRCIFSKRHKCKLHISNTNQHIFFKTLHVQKHFKKPATPQIKSKWLTLRMMQKVREKKKKKSANLLILMQMSKWKEFEAFLLMY